MSLGTAIVIATVFAIFSLPFRHYLCWYSWSRPGAIVGVTLYLILAGGGGGVLGWGAARLGHASPTSSAAVNGLFYGAAGAVALRADFRVGRQSTQLKEAVTLLGVSLQWTKSFLDEVTLRRAQHWFMSLTTDQLRQQSWQIQGHIATRQLGDRAKKELFARFVPAAELMAEADLPKQAEGRALLATFCAGYCVGEHVAKPISS